MQKNIVEQLHKINDERLALILQLSSHNYESRMLVNSFFEGFPEELISEINEKGNANIVDKDHLFGLPSWEVEYCPDCNSLEFTKRKARNGYVVKELLSFDVSSLGNDVVMKEFNDEFLPLIYHSSIEYLQDQLRVNATARKTRAYKNTKLEPSKNNLEKIREISLKNIGKVVYYNIKESVGTIVHNETNRLYNNIENVNADMCLLNKTKDEYVADYRELEHEHNHEHIHDHDHEHDHKPNHENEEIHEHEDNELTLGPKK